MKEKLWFKTKRYGWGWTPSSWEGWTVLALYVACIGVLSLTINSHATTAYEGLHTYLPGFFLLTVLLIIICWKKGESPRWRWGDDDSEDEQEL